MPTQVCLSELVASGVTLRPAEAVAIVGEICRQRAARLLPGLPSPAVVRLTQYGEILIEGPVPAGDDVVARAGQLLDSLLPPFDAPPEYRASGALRLVIARALGTLDLPPYASLEEFCGALVRFTTLDAREVVTGLVAAWHRAQPAVEAPAVADVVEFAEVTLLTDARPADAAAAPSRPRKAEYALWIAAPAAAAVFGYVLALPLSRAALDRNSSPPVERATVEAIQPVPPLPPQAELQAAQAEPQQPLEAAASPRLLQAHAYSPAFAPSGAIYFHDEHGGKSELKLVEAGGAGSKTNVKSILDDRALNFHPRPSPDGSRIAFDSNRDGTRAVFVANADGSDVRRISGEGFASVPSWSPDGGRLAFVRGEPGAPNVWNLWLANADGSNLRRLTHHRVGQAWGGSWFPDGHRIAYSVESRLVILDLTTGRSRTLQSPLRGQLVRTPAVSPDGRRIIFQVRHDGTWLADAQSGQMERVLADPTAEEFTWAADGRHVAYHSRRNGSWSVWEIAL